MKKIFLVLVLSAIVFSAWSQNRKPILLGVNPSVTRDKTYPKGYFDINVLPLVIEYKVVKNLDIRMITVLNYGFRNYGSALIDVGAEIAVPYYFDFSTNRNNISKGFFIGPGAALSRNIHYENNAFSIFFEPGYSFLFNEKFSLIIDMQYGRSYYNYDDGSKLTTNHFGVKVILGWWI